MSERMEIVTQLFYGSHYSDGGPPENAIEFVAWLNGLLLKVPEAHRASTTIKCSGDYDSGYAVDVEWRRPETDEEYNSRLSHEAAQAQAEQAHQISYELQALAALKAKYERP